MASAVASPLSSGYSADKVLSRLLDGPPQHSLCQASLELQISHPLYSSVFEPYFVLRYPQCQHQTKKHRQPQDHVIENGLREMQSRKNQKSYHARLAEAQYEKPRGQPTQKYQ